MEEGKESVYRLKGEGEDSEEEDEHSLTNLHNASPWQVDAETLGSSLELFAGSLDVCLDSCFSYSLLWKRFMD